MKINTRQFGEIEFEKENIVSFPAGLFGFEKIKDFLFLKRDEELFYWLNSVEQPDLCFPLFGIRVLDESYPSVENHEPFGIVTMNPDALKTTINLKSPVYINQDERTGFQKIFDKDKYPFDYKLFTE